MKISAEDAVEHIYNSLDGGNVTGWYDLENEQHWNINIGGSDVIEISVEDEDGEEIVSQSFRLVPQ